MLNLIFQRDWQVMKIDERFSNTFDANDTHLSSSMTLKNITNQDTGYFRFYYGEAEMSQYVYVFGLSLLHFKRL
jgi:hypothetical protein